MKTEINPRDLCIAAEEITGHRVNDGTHVNDRAHGLTCLITSHVHADAVAVALAEQGHHVISINRHVIYLAVTA